MRPRPEAQLERDFLLAIGRVPDVLVMKNEVGVGYRGTLRDALAAALAPFGKEVVEAAEAVLMRQRIKYGLGVGSPDLALVVGRLAAGLELKVDTDLSEDQRRYHAAAHRRGIPVAVARSVDEGMAFVDRVRRGAAR